MYLPLQCEAKKRIRIITEYTDKITFRILYILSLLSNNVTNELGLFVIPYKRILMRSKAKLDWIFTLVLILLYVFIFIVDLAIKIKLNQLHAVSRIQQGRQREPSVKTRRSPLFAEFFEVLSSGTLLQCRAVCLGDRTHNRRNLFAPVLRRS